MSRFIDPVPQYILGNGDVAAGGKLYLYEFNTDTLLTIYADEDETVTIANPVTLGSRGEVPNIFFSVAARAVLDDADGNQIFDVQPTASAGGASGGVSGWSANQTYGQLSIVFGSNGEFYISLVNDNVGNDPVDDSDDSSNWTRIDFLRYWNNLETFESGQLVVANGRIWVSQINDNLGFDPTLDTVGNWLDLTDASTSPYDNSASGLTSGNVQGAIDQLRSLINAIIQPLSFMGVLDVSAGDGALPGAPANGDLYVIGVGGTITVSTDGAAATPTAVTQGDVIAWNDGASRWDLLPSTESAASISYSNATSGLSATNVQTAIDEVEGRVDTNEADILVLQNEIDGVGAGVTYKGQLDVSAGDSALPAGPEAGDLYGISVGGTITVSVDGAAPAATAVIAGQQIVYNASTPAFDLLSSVNEAGEISYDNSTSGLTAVNVQAAIDEVYITKWESISTSQTLVENTHYSVDFTAGPLTLTLPATPANNDFVQIYKSDGLSVDSIIARNGETIMGLAEDLTINFETTSLYLVYNGSDWRIVR